MNRILDTARRISLLPKMLFITMLVGLIVSVMLDHFQTKRLRSMFESDLTRRLAEKAQDERIRFDNHLEKYNQAVRLIVSQRVFYDYVAKKKFPDGGLVYHAEIPPWLPDASVLRYLVPVQFAVLMDGQGKAREIYSSGPEPPPRSLLNLSNLLIQLSHNQSFTTDIEGMPFVLALEYVKDPEERDIAALLLANHINDDFIFSSQGLMSSDTKVALVGGDPQEIVASGNPDIIPVGASIGDLGKDYLITGKSFFDRGASDLILQFTSFISKKEFEKLSESILKTERFQRMIISFSLIISFGLIMLWITGNIRKLTFHITDFSRNKLDMPLPKAPRGDQLTILRNQFNFFTGEIVTMREQLKKQAEELLKEKNELSGLLPICAWCKKIRNDEGYWQQIETYISEHSNALFTHGICLDCLKKLRDEEGLEKSQE